MTRVAILRLLAVTMKTILLAVGGNSLIRAGEKGTIAEQLANARRTAAQIVALCAAGHRVVLTHGNGPQVGAALLRSERGASEVPGQPLDVCDACTQGEIGYLLEQSLETELKAAGLHMPVAVLLTQCVVSAQDPAMQAPELSRSGHSIRKPRLNRGSGNSDGRSWKTPRVAIAAWCPRRYPSRLSNWKSFATWSSATCW